MAKKTLRVALESYRHFLNLDSPEPARANGKRRSMINTLIRHLPDSPLKSLTSQSCLDLIDYWRQRPELDSGRRASKSYCTNCIQELVRFIDWLDAAEQFDWRIPNGLHMPTQHTVSQGSDCRDV